ncbi:hypothetical protein EV702DRAFT_973264 [Suillus placidus]|uniref:Uncharacterized protein n=1 Tax=Suillus placidus TaxID=48579 RepID=A0A9P7D1S9_9AGAM|nr:hypothetical protein EV702DRAFT_973264 [Suillus placidus]
MASVPLPDGLTLARLKEAKGAEIVFWISQANATAGKRVMTKNGHVDDQRKRLADYYSLDLSADAVIIPSVAPKTHEDHIKQHQFGWLQELGDEWSSMAAYGKEFIFELQGVTSVTSPSADLMAALPPEPLATQPNLVSLPPSHQLQVLLPTILSMAQSAHPIAIFAHPVMSLPLILQLDSSASPPMVMPPASLSKPPSAESPQVALPCTASDMAVLNSCQLDIESIQHAQDLCEAIQQVENGTISRIHECYGPQDGRATDEMWGHLKGKITKHERLYGLLTSAFEGDKDRFFEYFTVPAASKGKKQSHGKHKLVALQLIVEAIPRCQKDLQDKRQNNRYIDPVSGQFSEELWKAVWGGRNDWYVWRALGREWYGSKKALRGN